MTAAIIIGIFVGGLVTRLGIALGIPAWIYIPSAAILSGLLTYATII